MAGKIIADTIESAGSQISLNVGNVTILTASSTGLTLIPTTNVNVNLTNSIVTLTNGSATSPGLTFSGNTRTGLFMPAANTVAFTAANTESMRIDSAGNVGIGTATPTDQRLKIKQSADTGAASFSFKVEANANDTGLFLGYRGVGAASAADTCAILASYTSTGAYKPLTFLTSDAERMRIDTSGNLLVGKTGTSTLTAGVSLGTFPNFIASAASPSDGPYIQIGNIAASVASGFRYISFRVGSAGNETGSISTNGSTTTSYVTSSDYRLKENIQPMTGALAKVAQLNPVTYKWKLDGTEAQGFIAHEIQAVVPDCVTGEKDAVDGDGNPKYQGIDTSFLVATLTAAIQELKVIVDAQAVEIAALKAK